MARKGLWLRSIVLGAVVLMATGAGHTFDGNDVLKIKTTKRCRSCDLYAAELAGADLSGADLTAAKLVDAKLAGANLNSARLAAALWMDGRTCAPGSIGACK